MATKEVGMKNDDLNLCCCCYCRCRCRCRCCRCRRCCCHCCCLRGMMHVFETIDIVPGSIDTVWRTTVQCVYPQKTLPAAKKTRWWSMVDCGLLLLFAMVIMALANIRKDQIPTKASSVTNGGVSTSTLDEQNRATECRRDGKRVQRQSSWSSSIPWQPVNV